MDGQPTEMDDLHELEERDASRARDPERFPALRSLSPAFIFRRVAVYSVVVTERGNRRRDLHSPARGARCALRRQACGMKVVSDIKRTGGAGWRASKV